MSRFGELDPTKLSERDSLPGKFYLEIERVRACAKQNGDLAQRNAFFSKLFNPLSDEPRLLILIGGGYQQRRGSLAFPRKQSLRIAFSGVSDQRVRYVEDRLSASEVLFQFYDLRAGKQLRELEHVSKASASE